jgi:predicted enzyme related to lactoylglutathione lyase
MAKVTGIGGVFFKSQNPAALTAWYKERLGLEVEPWGGVQFRWLETDGKTEGHTVWNPFKETTDYFAPSERPYMMNLRVDDLDGILASLREAGARVLDRREDSELGKFGYVVDPDGTLLELWEPPPSGA